MGPLRVPSCNSSSLARLLAAARETHNKEHELAQSQEIGFTCSFSGPHAVLM
jgi:hypothetical protein